MGNVWDRTAEFLSDNLGSVMPLALLAIFVPAVISGNFSELQQGAGTGLALGLGIGSLVLALVGFWGQLAITALALDPSLARAAGATATRRFPAALLVMIVILAAMLVAILPVPVILAVAGVDLTAAMRSGAMPSIPSSAGLWIFLYLLILFPLILWAMARLAVALPALVDEGLALGAIGRSWTLTRGATWRIVGVLLLYVVVSTVANLAATTAFGAIMYLVAGRGEDGLSLATVLTTIVGGAVATGFTVLAAAFTAKLFEALRARSGAAAAR
jgi:hypothetical protein